MSALVLVAEASVTSSTTYVSLTGFSDSYYTYKVLGSGIKQGTLGNLTFRFLDADSGTAGLSTQHYDFAGRQLKSTGGDVQKIKLIHNFLLLWVIVVPFTIQILI